MFKHLPKGPLIALLIFVLVFGLDHWIAAVVCWGHFVLLLMPKSWYL